MLTELFPGMDVGQVDLDRRDGSGSDGVPDGNACVGISPRIDDNRVVMTLGLLDPSHQLSFGVVLLEINLHLHPARFATDFGFNVSQRLSTVGLGLSLAQQVQVGPVQEQNLHIATAATLGR